MSKTLFVLICTAVLTFFSSLSQAKKCPNIQDLEGVNGISYDLLIGNWFSVATKPRMSEKCKNFTIEMVDNGRVFTLHEEYFKKELHFWNRHSSKDYYIVKQPKPSPILQLKNKSWNFVDPEKYVVFAVDYPVYLVLYSCSQGVFSKSETMEVWSRRDAVYNATTIPEQIKDVLTKYKISPEHLNFRTPMDC